MDFVLLAGLGVMIFYAYRLSKSLDNFKKYREEFGQVIRELGQYIDEAQGAIDKLKDATQLSGEQLDDRIKDATLLADELQLINDAGNSLATRLEVLAEKNRKLAQGDEEESLRSAGGVHDFMIQDRDYELGEESGDEDGFESVGGERFSSQAEKELYDALQTKKKSGRGR